MSKLGGNPTSLYRRAHEVDVVAADFAYGTVADHSPLPPLSNPL